MYIFPPFDLAIQFWSGLLRQIEIPLICGRGKQYENMASHAILPSYEHIERNLSYLQTVEDIAKLVTEGSKKLVNIGGGGGGAAPAAGGAAAAAVVEVEEEEEEEEDVGGAGDLFGGDDEDDW
jgi:large subunit ribosomal protein LP2